YERTYVKGDESDVNIWEDTTGKSKSIKFKEGDDKKIEFASLNKMVEMFTPSTFIPGTYPIPSPPLSPITNSSLLSFSFPLSLLPFLLKMPMSWMRSS